jgi:hypothetical protein
MKISLEIFRLFPLVQERTMLEKKEGDETINRIFYPSRKNCTEDEDPSCREFPAGTGRGRP